MPSHFNITRAQTGVYVFRSSPFPGHLNRVNISIVLIGLGRHVRDQNITENRVLKCLFADDISLFERLWISFGHNGKRTRFIVLIVPLYSRPVGTFSNRCGRRGCVNVFLFYDVQSTRIFVRKTPRRTRCFNGESSENILNTNRSNDMRLRH